MRWRRLLPFFLILTAGLCAAWPFRHRPSPPAEPAAEVLPLALTRPLAPTKVQQASSGGDSPVAGLEGLHTHASTEDSASAEVVPAGGEMPRDEEGMTRVWKLTSREDPLAHLAPPPPLPAVFGTLPAEEEDGQPSLRPHALQFSSQSRARAYRLRDGDSLENLAERFLGDANRAEEIFQANRHLLAHPDLLPIGKTILIPPRIKPEELEPAAAR